jgi:hypothetical protein
MITFHETLRIPRFGSRFIAGINPDRRLTGDESVTGSDPQQARGKPPATLGHQFGAYSSAGFTVQDSGSSRHSKSGRRRARTESQAPISSGQPVGPAPTDADRDAAQPGDH